jgi:hypothetical protein
MAWLEKIMSVRVGLSNVEVVVLCTTRISFSDSTSNRTIVKVNGKAETKSETITV